MLINSVSRSSQSEVIDHVFESAKADIIKSIPLSSTSQLDAIIWPFTLSGRYSVQSGYWFLQESADTTQRPAQDSGFWKNLWGMEVPSKIKISCGVHVRKLCQPRRICFVEKSPPLQCVTTAKWVVRIVHMQFSFVLTCKWYGARIHSGAGSQLCKDVLLWRSSREPLQTKEMQHS